MQPQVLGWHTVIPTSPSAPGHATPASPSVCSASAQPACTSPRPTPASEHGLLQANHPLRAPAFFQHKAVQGPDRRPPAHRLTPETRPQVQASSLTHVPGDAGRQPGSPEKTATCQPQVQEKILGQLLRGVQPEQLNDFSNRGQRRESESTQRPGRSHQAPRNRPLCTADFPRCP